MSMLLLHCNVATTTIYNNNDDKNDNNKDDNDDNYNKKDGSFTIVPHVGGLTTSSCWNALRDLPQEVV